MPVLYQYYTRLILGREMRSAGLKDIFHPIFIGCALRVRRVFTKNSGRGKREREGDLRKSVYTTPFFHYSILMTAEPDSKRLFQEFAKNERGQGNAGALRRGMLQTNRKGIL
jgi:hypothetical protein